MSRRSDFQGTTPDGTLVHDANAYCSAWQAVYQPIEQATGATCLGFEPGLLLKDRRGFVFDISTDFVDDKGVGIFKIGRSLKPKERQEELRAGNPYGKMLFAGFVGGRARELEGYYHRLFRLSWIEREFFKLSREQLADMRDSLKSSSTVWLE